MTPLTFTENSPGINEEIIENFIDKEPYDFFKLLFTNEIIHHIVIETNRYAAQTVKKEKKPNSRVRRWTDTNEEEIELFFGLIIWMGLCRFPKICDYWSQNIIYSHNIRTIMSRNRFELLLRMLHFNDNEGVFQNDDRLRKISPLVDMLKERFQSVLIPQRDICIDETLVPFRGRLGFRQYIQNKRHKFGIKLFKLCCKDGYTYNLSVYCGQEHKNENLTVPTSVVLKLIEPLLDKGRVLYVDNYYTSVELAKVLLHRKTHLVGTLRRNRRQNSKEVVNTVI